MTAEALILSVSVEGMVAARDVALQVVEQSRDRYEAAHRQAETSFDVKLPRIELHAMSGRTYDLHSLDPEQLRRHIDATFWASLMRQSNMEVVMSTTRVSELRRTLYEEGDVPEFTAKNVWATFEDLAGRADEFFAESVEALFRSISWDHRTNSPCKLTPRMILRGCYTVWGYMPHDAAVYDLERLLCLVAKRTVPAHGAPGLRSMGEVKQDGEWRDVPAPDGGSSLLAVRGYKVGTMHVQCDAELIDALNRVMARRHPGKLGPPKK